MKYAILTTVLLFSFTHAALLAESDPAESKIKREYHSFKVNMESKLKKVDDDISKLEELKKIRGEISHELKDMSDTTRDQYSKFKATIQSKFEELSAKTKETAKKVID